MLQMKFNCRKNNNKKSLKAVYPNIKLGIVKKMKKKYQSSKGEKKKDDCLSQKLREEVNRYKQEYRTMLQKQDEIERELNHQQEKITNIENHYQYLAEQFSQRLDQFEDQQIRKTELQNQYIVQQNNITTQRQEEFEQFQVQHIAFESNRQDEVRINETQKLEEKMQNIEKKYDQLIRFLMYSS